MTTTNDGRHLVFTYGTLMTGQCNHRLLSRAEFVAETAVEGFDMFEMPNAFPMIVASDQPKLAHGEVFAVTDDELADLDRLEEYSSDRPDRSMYLRQTVTTIDGHDVWVYVWNSSTASLRPVPAGYWPGDREPDHVKVTHGDGVEREGTALDIVARMAAEGRARGGHSEPTIAEFVQWSIRTATSLTGRLAATPCALERDELAAEYLAEAARLELIRLAPSAPGRGVGLPA